MINAVDCSRVSEIRYRITGLDLFVLYFCSSFLLPFSISFSDFAALSAYLLILPGVVHDLLFYFELCDKYIESSDK